MGPWASKWFVGGEVTGRTPEIARLRARSAGRELRPWGMESGAQPWSR